MKLHLRAVAAAIVAAVLAALTVAASYLGGLLDPDAALEDMPLVVVDLDRGAALGAEQVEAGAEVVAAVRSPDASLGGRVRWDDAPTRDAALRLLARDEAYAALVVPADFSERLVALGTDLTGDPPLARLEVLTNPAAGSYAGSFAQSVAQAAADSAGVAVSQQLVDTLTSLGVQVPAAAAARIGRPVETTVTVAEPLGGGAGRGLAPFYFAVVLTIAGVVTATLVHVAVEWSTGRSRLELLGRELPARAADPGARRRFALELGATTLAAVLVALAVSGLALGPLGMEAENTAGLIGLAVLGAVAAATIGLAFLWALGVLGSLFAVLFTTILGVPAAGGVYPHEATPGFFQAAGRVLPLRYLTDGARALLYFDATRPGLGAALLVLATYVVAGTVGGLAVSRLHHTAAAGAGTGR